MLKNEMGALRKNRREGFEKSCVPLHAGRGVKNCQNHPYVINEWPPKLFYKIHFAGLLGVPSKITHSFVTLWM